MVLADDIGELLRAQPVGARPGRAFFQAGGFEQVCHGPVIGGGAVANNPAKSRHPCAVHIGPQAAVWSHLFVVLLTGKPVPTFPEAL